MIHAGPAAAWSSLVIALGHSLWQAAFIALAAAAILSVLPNRFPNIRYAVCLAAFSMVVFSWLVTWSWLEHEHRSLPPAIASRRLIQAEHDAAPARTAVGQSTAAPREQGFDPSLSADKTALANRASPGADRWNRILLFLWAAGAAGFQWRLVQSVVGAARLRRTAEPVQDPESLAQFEDLLARLDLPARVKLLQTTLLRSPAVFGVFEPVILFPTALMTGIPAEQIRGILAHELAHIRRHDFAVQLLQTAFEGLLFFNPFVWWISGQVRREREACCDALAARVTGEPAVYARALTTVAESLADHSCAAAAAGALHFGKQKGELLDRVRRLLEPSGRPELRLPVRSAAVFLAVSALSFASLKLAAVAAVEVLSPKARLERFAELRTQYPDFEQQYSTATHRKITIAGMVKSADGKPLAHVPVGILTTAPRSSTSIGADTDSQGRFTVKAPAGHVSLGAFPRDYAPAFLDGLAGTQNLTGLDLVVQPGFSSKIQFLNKDNQPIPRVVIKGGFNRPGTPMFWTLNARSDSNGIIELKHLASVPLVIESTAPGFQPASQKGIALTPGATLKWPLRPAVHTRGRVVRLGSREPVADAKIYLGSQQGPDPKTFDRMTSENLLAVTDNSGWFESRALRDDSRYYFAVTGDGSSGVVAGPVDAGQKQIEIELPPAQFIHVRVENVWPKDLNPKGDLQLEYSHTLQYGNSSMNYSPAPESFFAKPTNGTAEFRVGPIWQTPGGFHTAGQHVWFQTAELSSMPDPVVIPLPSQTELSAASPARKGTVVIHFRTPENHPAPTGSVLVAVVENSMFKHRFIPITNGIAQFEISTPTHLEVKPQGTVGYWFAPITKEIAADDARLRFEVDPVPSGAVYGKVIEEDGSPASGVLVGLVTTTQSPLTKGQWLGLDIKSSTSGEGDRENRFLAGPLPMGGTYRICAHRGYNYILSEPLEITEASPFHEITMRLARGVDISGRLLDPTGRPVPGMKLDFYLEAPGGAFGGPDILSAPDGRFRFPNVNLQSGGAMFIEIRPAKGFQPARVPIRDSAPIDLTLTPGLIIDGTVLDGKNRWPIPGAEVYAVLKEPATSTTFDAEGPADAGGHFRFSNLKPGQYEISSRSGQLVGRNIVVPAGMTAPVELRIALYPWSKLTPRKPAAERTADSPRSQRFE